MKSQLEKILRKVLWQIDILLYKAVLSNMSLSQLIEFRHTQDSFVDVWNARSKRRKLLDQHIRFEENKYSDGFDGGGIS